MLRRVLLTILCTLAFGGAVLGQERFGPPMPGTQSGPEAREPLADALPAARDPLNPLGALAEAGAALPGTGGEKGKGLSAAINVVVVLTVLSLVPSIMLMTTCFMRIIVVLGLLKQALGTQQLPPTQVITGLALVMTMIVMAPTIDRINKDAIAPYRSGAITDYDVLWERAKAPLREFMFDQIERQQNYGGLLMVMNYRGIDTSQPEKLTRAHADMITLVPAYMLSELKTAFLMGFKVYLPFLVIDMVISSLLISMSMMMLPPVLISLPFKLLLFVLVDGWALVASGLMNSFTTRPLAPAAVAFVHDVLAPVFT